MSKNKKKKEVLTNDEMDSKEEVPAQEVPAEVEKQENDKKKAKEQNQKKPKKDKKKEKGKVKKFAKETVSELKRVIWPTFGEVCKKTGVVLVVVLVFAVIIFGMDYGLGALMSLLKKGG